MQAVTTAVPTLYNDNDWASFMLDEGFESNETLQVQKWADGLKAANRETLFLPSVPLLTLSNRHRMA